jgi:hypothetical protein
LLSYIKAEHRLRVIKEMFPMRISGSKRDEITGGWRKLHNVGYHNLYSPSMIRMIKFNHTKEDEMGGASSTHKGEKGSYRVLVGSPEGKRTRDSVVGIVTSYGLDDRGVGVRVPVGSRIFSSPRRPDRLWGPPSILSNGYRGSFPGGKATGSRS